MRVGFTGTRYGMTDEQKVRFASLLATLGATEFHHGDCVGADDQAAAMASCNPKCRIICHPPVDVTHRAYNKKSHEIRPPKTHFARNRDIVNETDILIATPLQAEHQSQGGTWYTIDFAMKMGKVVHIICPDGRIKE